MTIRTVVDLCCGHGGWTRAFLDTGYQVIGFDIRKRKGYPGKFVLQDITTLDGLDWHGRLHAVIASPPCTEFSHLTKLSHSKGQRGPPDPEKGLVLVRAVKKFIDDAQPKYWAVENVRGGIEPISSVLGPPKIENSPWYIWGNFPGFVLSTSKRMGKGGDKRGLPGGSGSAGRWRVPYPIAKGVAEAMWV